MPSGWRTTWNVLAASRNESAVPVLVSAIDRAPEEIAEQAMEVLLRRRSPLGYRELLLRWDRLSSDWRDRLVAEGVRFANAVRDALLSRDETLWRIGCEAVLWMREYDLVAVLLLAVEEREGWVAEMAADTIVSLSQMLDEELRSGPIERGARDPRRLKVHALEALARAADQFDRHRNRSVIESFLLLAEAEHPTLLDIVGNPHHPAFLVVLDLLKHSTRPAIVGLVFDWLQAGLAPISVLKIVAQRNDVSFVRRLLTAIGPIPSPTVKSAFRRLESVSWVVVPIAVLEQLDDVQQAALVRIAVASGMARVRVFEALRDVMLRGRTGGRRAASEALVEFGGAEANELAVRGLDDPDPIVQANLIRQLRSRSVPGCITRLVEALESPHSDVRQAARDSLGEFTFRKFITALDLLEEDVRSNMGRLVRRVDPDAVGELCRELHSPARTRRLRAIEAAVAMNVVQDVEVTLIELLSDEKDHLVRAAVVRALGQSRSPIAEAAIAEALRDPHPTVREEAQQAMDHVPQPDSLESLGRLTALVEEAGALLGGQTTKNTEDHAGVSQLRGASRPRESRR